MTTTTRRRIRWTYDSTTGGLTAHLPDGRRFTFCRPGGRYVRCDMGDERLSGSLGRQICYGGYTTGNTVFVDSDEEFVAECKRWMRQYQKDDVYA